MSFQAMNWATQVRTGNPGAKAVLLAMANYADQDGVCFPGQERLAWDTEQGERTVRRHVSDLVGMGLIQKRVRGGRGRGRWSNVYQLMMGQPAKLADVVADMDVPTVVATGQMEQGNRPLLAGEPPLEPPPLPTSSPTGDGQPSEPPGQLPLSLPSVESDHPPASARDTRIANEAQLDQEFDGTFWPEYPRKVGKDAARVAYRRVRRRGVTVDEVMAGLRRFVKEKVDTEARFIAHASTWLNAGRWADEPDKPSQATSGRKNGHRPYRNSDYWSTP